MQKKISRAHGDRHMHRVTKIYVPSRILQHLISTILIKAEIETTWTDGKRNKATEGWKREKE